MSAHTTGDTLVVTLAGDLTTGTAAALAAIPDQWLTVTIRHVVVDVGGVDFCDAAGLRLLLRAWRVTAGHSASFTLRQPSDYLCWLMDLTGTSDVLFAGAGEKEETGPELGDLAGNNTDDGAEVLDGRQQDLDDRELAADERDKLLDERNDRVRAHQEWEDIREDLADEREHHLERREHHLPADSAEPE